MFRNNKANFYIIHRAVNHQYDWLLFSCSKGGTWNISRDMNNTKMISKTLLDQNINGWLNKC